MCALLAPAKSPLAPGGKRVKENGEVLSWLELKDACQRDQSGVHSIWTTFGELCGMLMPGILVV